MCDLGLEMECEAAYDKNGFNQPHPKNGSFGFGQNGTNNHFHPKDKIGGLGNSGKPTQSKKLVIKNFKRKYHFIIFRSCGRSYELFMSDHIYLQMVFFYVRSDIPAINPLLLISNCIVL